MGFGFSEVALSALLKTEERDLCLFLLLLMQQILKIFYFYLASKNNYLSI
jgi:hypothetical protein